MLPNYSDWNKAIIEYFVSGLQNGATVYLSLDDDALMDIGRSFKESSSCNIQWVKEFISVVRTECIVGRKIRIDRISGFGADQLPNCVAFLGAMVLAAYHMAEEDNESETISEINYFTRLRQVLDLPDHIPGRPSGLPTGAEEGLWKEWNRWIIQNSWLPSAEVGQGAFKFINYSLSQTLLRQGDRLRLERFFRREEKLQNIQRNWDRDELWVWLQTKTVYINSKHLQELFQETDFRRFEAITDAVYDVYSSIDWDQDAEQTSSESLTKSRRLTAGLYRVEDPITGLIEYYLYPRQPKRWQQGTKLEIMRDTQSYNLRIDRQGWFLPLWPENPTGGTSYQVNGDSQIKELVLPERRFWIFIRDPENRDSGTFASWGQPGIGETFLLLCRKEYCEQLEVLEAEKLLSWNYRININDEWVEYRECMILSQNWDGLVPLYQDIFQALMPNIQATIALRGGLRVPRQKGWIENYGPEVIVYSFEDSVRFQLINILDADEAIIDDIVNTNKTINIPVLTPGDYLLQVYISDKLAARQTLKIFSWESLDCVSIENSYYTKINSIKLIGAFLEEY